MVGSTPFENDVNDASGVLFMHFGLFSLGLLTNKKSPRRSASRLLK